MHTMPQPPDPPARASPAAASASATPQHHNQLQHQQPHDRQQHHHHHYPQPQQQHQQQQYSSQYAHYATPPASVSANSQPTSINGLPTRSHQSPHPPPITPAFHHHHPPPPQQQYAGSDPARHTSYGHDSVHGGSNGHPGAHKPLYPLQPQPQQRLDNGSQKKEIKRRTKTGCLTCRRRRIKCDEGQPTCGNCRKSKRECLGYDPIFKSSPLHSSAIPSLQTYPQGLSSPAHHMQQPIRSPLSESRSSTHHLPPPIGLGSQSRTPPPPMPPLIRAQSHGSMHDSQMEQSLGHGSHSRDAHYSSTLSPMQEAHVPGLRTFRRREFCLLSYIIDIADSFQAKLSPSTISSTPTVSPSHPLRPCHRPRQRSPRSCLSSVRNTAACLTRFLKRSGTLRLAMDGFAAHQKHSTGSYTVTSSSEHLRGQALTKRRLCRLWRLACYGC